MRRLSEAPGHIIYEAGSVPFFNDKEISLHRTTPKHSKVLRQQTAGAAGALLQLAWIGSDWFTAAYRNPATHPLARQRAEAAISPTAMRLSESILRTYDRPARAAMWAAAVEDDINNPVGFSYISQDVSGSPLAKAYKRLARPEKEYAKVSDINVRKDLQGMGLGVMLLDAALVSVRDKEQSPTTYTPSSNEVLISRLGDIGFEVTGTQDRTDLVHGLTINEARLQAPSVAHVQGALHEIYPWLDHALVDPTFA